MDKIVERILDIPSVWIYVMVALLVFAEDAIFVGFVIPGETAAVVGGVAASQQHLALPLITGVVVAAAIVGDSVGYEIGKHLGPHLMKLRILDKRREKLDKARNLLAERGGWAVFMGRFVAFFRAVMPALAGMSNMRYPRFLTFNALGGLTWGITFVLLGYAAGNSYEVVAKRAGRGSAAVVAAIVVVALIVWRVRKHRQEAAR